MDKDLKIPEKVKKIIEQKYSKRNIATYTLQELTERNIKNNAQFMVLLNGFAIMAMVIGSFGIINNYIKKSFFIIFEN